MMINETFAIIHDRAPSRQRQSLYDFIRRIIYTRDKNVENSKYMVYISENKEAVIDRLVEYSYRYTKQSATELMNRLLEFTNTNCTPTSPCLTNTNEIVVDVPHERCEVVLKFPDDRTLKMKFS